MKKLIALLLALAMAFALVACGGSNTPSSDSPDPGTSTPSSSDPANSDPVSSDPVVEDTKSVGFVLIGLTGEFFQQLAQNYVNKMESLGWEASYADGGFDPSTTIEACENYIAMDVDVLVIWSVAPQAMTTVVEQAMAKGIKVISFVQTLEKYNVSMRSDDAVLAGSMAKLAAKWIDETYADAADHSVPVAVFSCRAAETGVLQADVLMQIEQYSTKAKFVTEVELTDEAVTTGMSAAENLYTTNPEIKVFLTAHNGLAQGINNYFTGLSSPVTDYSDMGIFCINGDSAVSDMIKASVTDEAPLRGTVMTGGAEDTANELADMITGIVDGSVEDGHIQYAGTLYVYADTIDEYIATGTVTSVTDADFE